ncbi:MAG: hypothetical protein ACP5I1_16285, partial [Candidatus Hinthialibacter sp.]
MDWKRPKISRFVYCLAAVAGLTMSSEAQYNSRYGGGNYNNYNNRGYSNSNMNMGNSRFGGSSYGNSRYGGSSYGGSSYGGSSYGGGFGSSSSRRGSSRSSGRSSSRSSRSSFGGGYDNYGGGYSNYGSYDNRSNSRSSRSTRSGYGGNFGGQTPQTAASQGEARQTTPTGMTSGRRAALSGKSSVRGVLPGGSSSAGGAGGVQVQGSAATSGRPTGARGKTAPARKQSDVKTKPMATLYL